MRNKVIRPKVEGTGFMYVSEDYIYDCMGSRFACPLPAPGEQWGPGLSTPIRLSRMAGLGAQAAFSLVGP